MIPETPIIPEMAFPEFPEKDSSNYGISLDTGILESAETGAPKDFTPPIEVIPGQTRILLSAAASRHLEATGETCFAIVSKAMHPEEPGRWVIHLVPCPLATARQAEGILFGTHKASKIKATSKP